MEDGQHLFQSEEECLKAYSEVLKEGEEKIPFDDMKFVVRKLGLSPSDIEFEECRMSLDPDGDGQVTKEEFLAFIRSQPQNPKEDLEEAFQCYANQDDGNSVDRNEMRAILLRDNSIDEDDVDKLLEKADKNKDGRLDIKEMTYLFTKIYKSDDSDSD